MERTPHRALPMHFGLLLKLRREQWEIKQREVLAYLPGWTSANYSRLESGFIAPAFENLLPIYKALGLAGLRWTAADRRDFIDLARRRIEVKKTHHQLRSDDEWAELYYQLTLIDSALEEVSEQQMLTEPDLAETRHLVGREAWLEAMVQAIQKAPTKKLLVLQGPMGIGKSSELHRLAWRVLHTDHSISQVIWFPLRAIERGSDPFSALESFLSTLLTEIGEPLPPTGLPPLDTCVSFVLTHLAHSNRSLAIFLDNAEGILTGDGRLAACWEQFLERFLRSDHHTTLVLATREWPGWAGRERVFVTESTVPPLPIETSILLLQRLGLEQVPLEPLRTMSERVGGVPLGLEWVAALAQDPLLLDDWESFERGAEPTLAERLQHLLDTPALLQGHFANKLQPLLERIIEQRLSPEARRLLTVLSVAPLPLGQPALKTLSEHPRPFKELRDASLLVAYPSRVQLLPMVAAAILHRLKPEQMQEAETSLITALTKWLRERTLAPREGGNVATELVLLLLKQRRLLEAAKIHLPYSSLSFNLGHAPRLARFAADVMDKFDWHATCENECGGLLLHYSLAPFLDEPIDERQRAEDYQHILDLVAAGQVTLWLSMEKYLVSAIMRQAEQEWRFTEAQALLEAHTARMEALQSMTPAMQRDMLELRAGLFGRWCDYASRQEDSEQAQTLRAQAIVLYRQCVALYSTEKEQSPLDESFTKTRLAYYSNALGYYLALDGQLEESLEVVEQAIALKEQGFLSFGGLAVSYGEKAEILMELGRLQEALVFDEKALTEIQRCAEMGHTPSQEERWMYLANRGRLYLRLGRIDEAEQILRECIPHIPERRRIYQMLAEDAWGEIQKWRQTSPSSHYQIDWRWVDRYRDLAAFDSFWWLAAAGPFTDEEQRQWDQAYASDLDETAKEQLGRLIARSRQRELDSAIAEQRQPRFHYPALAIDVVRRHIVGLVQLESDIQTKEPHPIVRKLYHDAIDEELDFLRLIEATYERDTVRYWNHMIRIISPPTEEEMGYALARVRQMLLQSLRSPEMGVISKQLAAFMCDQLHLSLDLSSEGISALERPTEAAASLAQPGAQPKISSQAVKRFLATVLREHGFDSWQVVIDPNTNSARIEQGLRQVFVADRALTVEYIKHLLSHELAGHVARCMAGERSLLGLLGIHTKNSLVVEEGLALYYDHQVEEISSGEVDTKIWIATLATGLGSGVLVPPQKFLTTRFFLELVYTLSQLFRYPNANKQNIREAARISANSLSMRTYRGVPDLEQAGVCYLQDALYLRGQWQIERAVAKDATMLDRLAVGVVGMEYLPEIEELGVTASPISLRQLLSDPDLNAYIRSFEETSLDRPV